MALHKEVISYLRPDGGIIATGDEYEGIEFVWAEPFTEAEYKAAFAKVDAFKAKQDADKAAAKAIAEAKLEALGLDADDLKALGL
jgi:hypothetical protein